jgi:hypothetical protein
VRGRLTIYHYDNQTNASGGEKLRPCECRSNPIIPVKANDWAYLNKCARVVEWMGSHGVCWRDATNANSSWRIGDETEWLYGDGHKVIKEVEEHMEFFRANDERTCADD